MNVPILHIMQQYKGLKINTTNLLVAEKEQTTVIFGIIKYSMMYDVE